MIMNADVVIVGGGAVGCSTAYQMAKKGFKRIALLEKRFLTSGSTGRCGGSLRGLWMLEITTRIVLGSLEIIRHLDEELEPKRGTEFKATGRLIPIYSDEQLFSFKGQLELAKRLSVATEVISPEEAKAMWPLLNTEGIQAFIYNLPSTGGLANPFYTTLALADKAKQMGVKICIQTEVIAVETSRGAISAVLTNRGKINTPILINATGPYAYSIGEMLGLDHPVGPQRHQIAITERIEPLVDIYYAVPYTGTYFFQLPNGGVVMGSANPDGEPIRINYNHGIDFLLRVIRQVGKLLPPLRNVRIIRQWAGHVDISKDGGPILGPVEEIDGYYVALACGKGFQMSFMIGKLMAELLSGEETTLPIKQLNISRFKRGELLATIETDIQDHKRWQT
jgi:sarcosine oxidase subunit beta